MCGSSSVHLEHPKGDGGKEGAAMTARATWSIRRREVAAMAIGVVLYAGLSWMTNVFNLAGSTSLQIRPGVAVPVFFGFVFGPIVGFVTGMVGNFLGDFASGYVPDLSIQPVGNPSLDLVRIYYLNWQIGNGLMGLIPGLAALFFRRYYTLADQLRALAVGIVAVILGMGFASYTELLVNPAVDSDTALNQYFLPATRSNLANAIVLVPILLFNYERFDLRSTDWLRTALMRRLLIAILVSAALPVALLGLFLTQQSTGTLVSPAELAIKLAFTVVVTLLFTITNAGLVAQSLSRPLLRLIGAAGLMEANQLTKAQAVELEATAGTDEIVRLSQVFGRMAQEVIQREQKLRQEIHELRFEIDEVKKARQVAEITETDYFRTLRNKAKQLRETKVGGEP